MPPFGPRLYLCGTVELWHKSRKAQYELLHDLLVVDCVSDVDVGFHRACTQLLGRD